MGVFLRRRDMKTWNTTEPPKSREKMIKIQFKDNFGGSVHTGTFIWCESESAFVQVTVGPDGVGLYEEDYTILGWREIKEK